MRVPVVAFSTAAILMAIGGCGASVRTTGSSTADLSRYQTYSFATSLDEPETVADQKVRSALQQDLAAKGIRPAATAAPDLIVVYDVEAHQAWGWLGANVSEYTKGTLVVELIDAHTQQVVWRGTATGMVDRPGSPSQRRLEKAVGKVVNRYPYAVAAAAAGSAM